MKGRRCGKQPNPRHEGKISVQQKSTSSERPISNPEALALEVIHLLHEMAPWPPMTRKQVYGSSRCFFCNLQPRLPRTATEPDTGRRVSLRFPLHHVDADGNSACPGEEIYQYLKGLNEGTVPLPVTEEAVRHLLLALGTKRPWPLHREVSAGNGRIKQDPVCHWCKMPNWEHTTTCPNSKLTRLILNYVPDGWGYRRKHQITVNPSQVPQEPRPYKPRRKLQRTPVSKPPRMKPERLV